MALGLIGSGSLAVAATDPAPKDYLWCQPLSVPALSRENMFTPEKNKANFTFFEGVDQIRVEAGALKFTLTTNQATLGWGNYLGKQPPAEMAQTPENWFVVELKVRQSGAPSQWSLRCWRNGKQDQVSRESWRGPAKPIVREVKPGPDWTNLVFELTTFPPDGLEIGIEGEPGATVEIERFKASAPGFEGYFRKEFDLPPVPVWQALAQVGGWGRYFVNGREVTNSMNYGLTVCDIRPYLKSGKNSIAVHACRLKNEAYTLFQCKIALNDGTVVPVNTDASWRFIQQTGPDWKAPGFNNADWQPATVLDPRNWLNTYLMKNCSQNEDRHFDLNALIRLRNPDRTPYLYSDRSNVVIEVLAPPGLKARNPVVEYRLAPADSQDKSRPGAAGQVVKGEEKDGSLVFRIDLGRQIAGVYAFEAVLKDQAEILEHGRLAPVMVLQTFEPLGGECGWSPEIVHAEVVQDRIVLRYEHEGLAAWGYAPGQRRFFDVVPPKNGGAKHPLLVCLHSAGEKDNTEWRGNVARIAATGDDFVGLIPNCNFTNEWWWGNKALMQDKEKYAQALTPVEARILATVDWVVRNYNIDRNRIYMHGISMGGSGALGMGMSHGDIFAAIFAGVPADANHMLVRQALATDKNPPPALVFFSQTDAWSAEMPLLIKAARDNRYALVCAWGTWGHINHYEMFNPAAFEFPWLSIRRNEAYPAFVNASADQKFPGCNSKEPDQEGQINAYFRWENQKDQPDEFAMQIRLVAPGELKGRVTVPREVVADVTLRRIQRFKVQPEGEYWWTVEADGKKIAGGKVKADKDALITVPGIKVTAQPLRLSIRNMAASPDR